MLVDADLDGSFANETPISGATVVNGGNHYLFSGVTGVENNVKFTFGFSSSSSLPVELLSFSAEIIDDEYVELKWITASEINNNYFTLEKSNDGLTYAEIAEVNGAGNSSSAITYIEEDYELIPGMSYYRLSQTDYDGQFKEFPPIMVEYNLEANELTIESFGPNPFDNTFTVTYSTSINTPLEISILNISGTEVFRDVLEIDEGFGKYTYTNGHTMIPGVYVLSIFDEMGNSVAEKIIKK